MSNNPYQASNFRKPQPRGNAKSQISGPAISLIVVASISLLLVGIGLIFDAVILATGAADNMIQPQGMPKGTQIIIRFIWGILLFASNIVVLIGSIKMLQLKSYDFAKVCAIISVIPCVGPCCIVGIPFGIWALVILAKPEVRNAFR